MVEVWLLANDGGMVENFEGGLGSMGCRTGLS